MRYMLLICDDPSAETAPEEGLGAETEAWVEEMEGRGVRKAGDRLRPASDATTVRVRGDEVLVTDGPFAEGKEYLGGFTIITAPDLDAALGWGRKLARATTLPIEVRPFQGEDER